MAIVGIGVDAVEIDRMRRALERTPTLADRVFTVTELAQCRSRGDRLRPARLAGRFAAKEAVAKAFGTGVVGFSFRDVAVVNDDGGAPVIVLANAARAVAERCGITRVHVSLSLTGGIAVATAVAEA
ncbi:MAG: holo-ACP synthase [Actinobacteria bacterium]|nr:holo-ACP synthase [Actinomycetota bacterium]